MTFIGGIAAAALLAAPLVSTPQASAPNEKIVIDVVTVLGSGCPTNTAAVAVSPDNTAFTVTYSNYLAQVGVGAKATDSRKNCQVNLRVRVPSGFTYAVAQTDHRGYGFLEKGATATARANYYFQGMSQTVYKQQTFRGPLDDNWQTTHLTDIAALSWHPCGESRNLNINTELRVAGGTSDLRKTTSFMTMDSTDGSIKTTYHLSWRRC
ncbi:MAG TPA: DUF4360 domain-containing protein [Pilimelia sp.]|nr:DUF4360 domain-containing protein [Pilimelia sp.]